MGLENPFLYHALHLNLQSILTGFEKTSDLFLLFVVVVLKCSHAKTCFCLHPTVRWIVRLSYIALRAFDTRVAFMWFVRSVRICVVFQLRSLMLLLRPARRTHRTSATTTRKKKVQTTLNAHLATRKRKSPFMACLYSRVVFYRRRRRIIKKIYLKLGNEGQTKNETVASTNKNKKKGKTAEFFCTHHRECISTSSTFLNGWIIGNQLFILFFSMAYVMRDTFAFNRDTDQKHTYFSSIQSTLPTGIHPFVPLCSTFLHIGPEQNRRKKHWNNCLSLFSHSRGRSCIYYSEPNNSVTLHNRHR